MSTRTRDRFDIGALRKLAGEKAFLRGQAYLDDDLVRIVRNEPGRVLANVSGTEDYRTEVIGSGTTITGECSCPAFADWGFCKHMVATALAANTAGPGAAAEGSATLTRIRDHLKAKGVDALADMILGLADRDPALFRRLDIAAAAAGQMDDKTLEARLCKAIDDATRNVGYVDYREADGWAAGVAEALDPLGDLAAGPRAGIALRLAERAIDRIWKAMGEMDDSDGHCGAVLATARDIHLAAANAIRPDPLQLARSLFAHETADEHDIFAGAADMYADVLGAAGLAEYRRLAAEAWAKLPPAAESGRRPDGYFALKAILDHFAERDGDVQARIALRKADLSSAWSYLELASFCLAQGLADDALRYAEEGVWLFDDDRADQRLITFAAELLVKAGRPDDAAAHLWRAFERGPNLDLYARLRAIGGGGVRDRAVALLTARLGRDKRSTWFHPADLLIELLTREAAFAEAWAVVREHGASSRAEEALARASEATHPREAVAAYAKRVEQLAANGGNASYEDAAGLVARMAGLRGPAEQGRLSDCAQGPSHAQAQFHAAAVIVRPARATPHRHARAPA